jgi:broad specificity phosphatase PhoE
MVHVGVPFQFFPICFGLLMLSRIAQAMATIPSSTRSSTSKQLFILRHGQATHNPRAEVAKDNGCTHEEFLELMRQDDSLDSPLTDIGKNQARNVYDQTVKLLEGRIQLVVSSPLSRAIQTADLAIPLVENRVCVEGFREISGWLLNAKRRPMSELQKLFPQWKFDELPSDHDTLWTPQLESRDACSERGYQGLCWVMERPEEAILLACHGGILLYTMNHHAMVRVVDGRTKQMEGNNRHVQARFLNCELRRYSIAWEDAEGDTESKTKRTIVLTELDQW